MKNNLIKILFSLMPMLLFTSALAVDLTEYGNFSKRSILMNEKQDKITQEKKDLLLSKKLLPTTQCLIEQIKKNNNENVQLLLDVGINPNESYYTEYPIYIAAKENNFVALKMLYEKGAKIDFGFNSELYEAIKNKNSDMAQFLLDCKANIHYKDYVTQNSLLYLALKNNMLSIAQQLINKGIAPDRKSVILIKKKKLFYMIEDVK